MYERHHYHPNTISAIFSSQSIATYFSLTDGHILSDDVTDGASTMAHLDLKLLHLFSLSSHLSIKLLFLRHKLICRLFSLGGLMSISDHGLVQLTDLFLGGNFFLDGVHLFT